MYISSSRADARGGQRQPVCPGTQGRTSPSRRTSRRPYREGRLVRRGSDRLRHGLPQRHFLWGHNRCRGTLYAESSRGRIHLGGVRHRLSDRGAGPDAWQRRTLREGLDTPPRRAATGRSRGRLQRGDKGEAFGLQRRGGGCHRDAEHRQEPERRPGQSTRHEAPREWGSRLGHAADAGRLQRQAREDIHRRCAAGRGGKGARPEQPARQLRRAHRGL